MSVDILGVDMRRRFSFVWTMVFALAAPIVSADEIGQAPVDNHIHMSWIALTQELNDWAEDYPDIVDLTDIGNSYLGKTLWVVRLSDWSMDTKPNGAKTSFTSMVAITAMNISELR